MPAKQVFTKGGNQLQIKEFKLESIAKYASIVMIAKRGSGKSWVCRALMNHFSDIPVGIIISPTDKMNCFYGKFFPDSYIYYDFTSELIGRVLERQERIINKNKEKNKLNKKIDTRSYIIMDDCLARKKSWAKDEKILELLFNGRHFKLMYILTMQFPLGISPELRTQFDYIFLLADDFYSNLKRIYDHYAGMFPTFESFRQIFKQLTSDFGCMVIVNTSRGQKKNDDTAGFLNKVFWYKADEVQMKEMGCSQFNKFHKKNFNKKWTEKIKQINVDDFCMLKKKEKTPIKIEKIED